LQIRYKLATRFLLTLLVLASLTGGQAQAAGEISFPQTGFSLADTHGFLSYWQAHGGLAQFGYPISPEASEVSPTNGRLYISQWFERNRFEFHPENNDPYRVLLGLLGRDLVRGREGTAFQRANDPQNSACLYFAPTGHSLCNSFRVYWEQHGGLALYGYPISEEFAERSSDGKNYTVQYFERNRFEYHAENKGTQYEVLLGLLGTQISGYPVPPSPQMVATTLLIPDRFKDNNHWAKPHTLTGPVGMKISLFATSRGPRLLTFAPNGDLFSANTRNGEVVVFPDRNHDGVTDDARVFVDNVAEMDKPHGLAFHKGYLYVASEKGVWRFAYQDGQLAASDAGQKIADLPSGYSQGLATGVNHDTRSLIFGLDDKMYVSMGSDCDLCEEGDPRRATIMKFNEDGSGGRIYASGLRNAVGLDFDPRSGQLWAAVNERNKAGNDFPPDYLTPIHEADYGWPYCIGNPPSSANLQPDPAFGKPADFCKGKEVAAVGLPAHMAPLGMRFYTGGAHLPTYYENGIFLAMHGSLLHEPIYGYEVRFVSLRPGEMSKGSQVAVSGWLVNGESWGRPVDVAFGKDGAMYISDDAGGAIYRATFNN